MAKLFNNLVLWMNNTVRGKYLPGWLGGQKRFPPEQVVLLFSHCLQNSDCPQKIVNDLANCKRCGKCVVKGLLELSERYQVRCAVASGGEMALQKVKPENVKAVLAIACEMELAAGISAIYPKPVVAIPNTRPHGPCKDCLADLQVVEEGLKRLLRHP